MMAVETASAAMANVGMFAIHVDENCGFVRSGGVGPSAAARVPLRERNAGAFMDPKFVAARSRIKAGADNDLENIKAVLQQAKLGLQQRKVKIQETFCYTFEINRNIGLTCSNVKEVAISFRNFPTYAILSKTVFFNAVHIFTINLILISLHYRYCLIGFFLSLFTAYFRPREFS